MKKIMLIVTVLIFFASCMMSPMEKEIDKMNSVPCPVIMTGESERGVLVLDGDGKIHMISKHYIFGASIATSYEVGDTIRFCK